MTTSAIDILPAQEGIVVLRHAHPHQHAPVDRGSYDASDTATKRGGGTSSPSNRSALTTGWRSTSDNGALADTLVSVRPHPCGGRIAIVRMLQPVSELADDDLQAAYAYPAERTWARLNVVASLDGGTADAAGRSEGLSSPGDTRVFALLRSLADVIVVGAGTVRAEGYAPVRPHEVDTGLRDRSGLAPLPPIAVVSTSLDLPDDLFGVGEVAAPTLVVTCAAAPARRLAAVRERAEVLVCGAGTVDHHEVREQLAARGLRRILCEGGPSLAGTMTAAGVLDEVCLTLSPLLLAGDARRMAIGPVLEPATTLRYRHAIIDGDHLLLSYVRAEGR